MEYESYLNSLKRFAAAVMAVAAACLLMSKEAASMSTSGEARVIPSLDREAPATVQTATFALG